MTREELTQIITKEMGLDYNESDMLFHDLGNLRGHEWLDDVTDRCSSNTIKEFKSFINWKEGIQMKVWIRNLTKNTEKELTLPMSEEKLDKAINPDDEYIIVDCSTAGFTPGEYDSIDELNSFLAECNENEVSEDTLNILSKVLSYTEVMKFVESERYHIIDFDEITDEWHCCYGGDFTDADDKGLCLVESGCYYPFEFEITKVMEKWIDWSAVWAQAEIDGWNEVKYKNKHYLVFINWG